MARATTPTLLPLDTFAKVMGINPVHFNGGLATTIFPVASNACEDLWAQYAWQYSDHISREDLALEIANAERDLAEVVGYWPAPRWTAQEVHRFPRHHRRDLWRQGGTNNRGARIGIQANYGKFIQGGQRNVDTLIGTANKAVELVYDLTTTVLTATITLPWTLTNDCEVKTYFASQSAAPEWEIRPARSVTTDGVNVVIVFDVWLLLKPSLWDAYPTVAGFSGINITDIDNYVDSVEVYREYNDWSATNATFYWEPKPQLLNTGFCTCGGSGCTACTLTTQDGCLHVRDTEAGLVVPAPGTYDDDDEEWDQSSFTECRDPDTVKLYYYSGNYSNRWLNGDVCEPISSFWAQIIAWLATARLERPFCSCGNVEALGVWLREDMVKIGETSFNINPELLENPFGTRRGEVEAWRKVNKVARRRVTGGVV